MKIKFKATFVKYIPAFLLAFTVVQQVLAQGTLSTTAQLFGVPHGGGTYDYTLTLNNTGNVSVGSFWYAWIPGYFFLPTMPTSAGAPSGWSASIVGNSIQYAADSSQTALSPGSSIALFFNSADSPAQLAGMTFGFPIGESFAYAGGIEADPGYEFTVQSVPEPSSLGLMLIGTASLAFSKKLKLEKFL